jgi:hypothetical protein
MKITAELGYFSALETSGSFAWARVAILCTSRLGRIDARTLRRMDWQRSALFSCVKEDLDPLSCRYAINKTSMPRAVSASRKIESVQVGPRGRRSVRLGQERHRGLQLKVLNLTPPGPKQAGGKLTDGKMFTSVDA